MNKSTTYEDLMYTGINLLGDDHGCMYNEDNKNIHSALIELGNTYLIEEVLNSNRLPSDIFSEILIGYYKNEELKKVLILLTTNKDKYHDININEFTHKFIKKYNDYESVKELALYLNNGNNPVKEILNLINILLKDNNFELINQITNEIENQALKETITTLIELKKGKIEQDKIIQLIENISKYEITTDKGEDFKYNYRKTLYGILFEGLKNFEKDKTKLIPFIIKYKENGIYKGDLKDIDLIEKEIEKYYFENGLFQEAKKLFGNKQSYYYRTYDEKITEEKLKYSIKHKKQELHSEALKETINLIEEHITKLENDSENKSRQKRINLCKLNAEKYSELAIYELLYGDKTKANEFIEMMINFTESISKNLPKDCDKSHFKHITRKERIPFKKELKLKFINAELLQFLPKFQAWNQKVNFRNHKIYEENRKLKKKKEKDKFEKIELDENIKLSKKFHELIISQNFEEIEKLLKKESNYSVNQCLCENSMILIDNFPDNFKKIYDILYHDVFEYTRYNDDLSKRRIDFKTMAQYIIKGIINGIITKDGKFIQSLINNLNRCIGSGGRKEELENFILNFIKLSLNTGLNDLAINLFKKVENTVSSKLKNVCIYYILKAIKINDETDAGYLAFNNIDVKEKDNFNVDEQINYYNIKSDISTKLGKEKEYENSKEKIFELLNKSENSTKSIRLWCKRVIKNCLRTGHSTRFTPKNNGDKKTYSSENVTPIFVELKDILNSSMGQNEKIRRRVIFTIIELGIIEANEIIKIEDFKSGSIPNRVQLIYMSKLVKKGLITNNTMHFLGKNKDKHTSNLIKLLTNYQNIYNVIIDNIHKYNEGISRQIERIKDDYIYRYIRNNEEINPDNFQINQETIKKIQELKKMLFKVSSWRKLFKVLRIFEGQSINYEVYTNNFHDITTHKKGPLFGYFMCVIRGNWRIDLSDFPINKNNFLNYMNDNDTLIEFEKDKGIKWEKTKPWTKKWFLEDEKRLLYLDGDKLKTFEKFGSIIAIGIIEGIKDAESIKKFYEYIFQNISYEKNRTSILQLGELFNLILKQGDYKIFEELINEKNNIGEDFKKFIETNKISDKGRTILTLMITKEIKESFSIWNDTKGEEKVDYIKIEELIKRVHSKLKLYQKEINKYNNFPIKISIGIEYEVTSSIARGYHERIGSDYKNDITTISEYAGISNGTDAIHEIATSPTDNPMLLILELKLLDDLDFLDLNFKHTDYEKGSRGIHITLGGEKGIKLDFDTNFIQNILIASNLGGLNAGNEIKTVNKHGKIREKGGDCKAVFTKEKTECVEFRSLGIDKKEQLERLIISIFNLCRAKHANDTFGAIAINDEKKVKAMELFSLLKRDIELIIENHNKNFLVNETKDDKNSQGLSNLINIVTSTSPLISLLKDSNIDIHYLRNLHKKQINNEITINSQEDFENTLKEIGITIENLSERQRMVIYKGYKLRFKKFLDILAKENIEIYNNIGEYLNGNTDETMRKITNQKRFIEVISGEKEKYDKYIEKLIINTESFSEEITPTLVNTFTRINNLFIKKDSTNALGMYDSTKEENGTLSDRRLSETTIFDKLEQELTKRKGTYIIQGASDNMLVTAIQKKILEFNEAIENL